MDRLIPFIATQEKVELAKELEDTKQAFSGPASTIEALENDVAQSKAALNETVAVFFVEMDQHLSIRASLKSMASRF